MKKFAVLLLAVVFSTTAAGAPNMGRFPTQEDAEKAEQALTANFHAFNSENATELVKTISMAGGPEELAEFREEAERLFEDCDVYLRLSHFEPFWIETDKKGRTTMLAIVVQHTICEWADEDVSTYRTYSALLPPHEFSYYQQEFVWSPRTREWRVGAIKTRPAPVEDPADSPPESVIPRVKAWLAREEARSGRSFVSRGKPAKPTCKDGNCSTPFVRVNVK